MTHNRRGASTEVKNENLEQQTMFDDLPSELLELIFSRLTLDNNIRASVVCKRWHSVATSVRVLSYAPWLMYRPLYGNQYEFYDPFHYKTYSIDLPELSGSIICYAKDGWLLLYGSETRQLFFFNPFTRDMIKLPGCDETTYLAAFSCAPTSSECVLFIVSYVSPSAVNISTCYPGAIEWTTVNYQNQLPLSMSSMIWNKVVFCNGLFYCLSFEGLLAMFDTDERSWTVLSVPLPKCRNNCVRDLFNEELMFMTEQEGNIIVITQCSSENPVVLKLDRTLMQWKVMRTLGGGTLFAGFMSSHSRIGLPRSMRNYVYFPVYGTEYKSTISFSLDDCSFYPHKNWFPPELIFCFNDIIWIEPPKDFSGFT
ncbi:hypothetical protein TanjilG_01342 [Lupinus angustifolius]|uniref:F-box domain-containing protein n=2 Tax=Lupinus angustifolius TaxID=3871 RepID=A0A4P1REY0_LUPAN|nr:hypothetical protein TanjilG_01342 [Lupinus angustifolius]